VATRAEAAKNAQQLEREWWRRTLAVLHRPRPVFEALRDRSPEAAAARQEPLTALVLVTGISIFLSTSTAGRLFDDYAFDALLVLVETVLAGTLVALQNFWLIGAALYLGLRGAELQEREVEYRQARHLVALATAPFLVSLVLVWPVRLALFGLDAFRSGGSDAGADGRVFQVLDGLFLAWALALLVLGVRTVYGWSWGRTLAATSLAGLFVGLAVVFFAVV
jgi:hypothetical protein